MPDVVGQSRDSATSTLQADGFAVNVTEQESATATAGNVISQSPAAGTASGRGSTVTITVAKAPPQANVPDVTGQRRSAATQQLHAAGFRVTAVDKSVQDPAQDGTVIAQDPGPGKADQGTTVTITIGRLTTSTGP